MKPVRQFESWLYGKFEHDDAKLLMRLGHLLPWVVTAWSAYSVVNGALGEPRGGAWGVFSGIGAFLMMYSVLGSVIHGRRLCERCAAYVPIDPESQVTRWKPVLWFQHQEKLVTGILIAILAWNWIAYWMIPLTAWWHYGTDIAIVIYILGFVWASWQHSRLRPWCPWCRWDDGGAKEKTPDPLVPEVVS